jgi:hypothetical protein
MIAKWTMLRALFKALSWYATVRAIQRGKLPQRLARRSAHRAVSRLMR